MPALFAWHGEALAVVLSRLQGNASDEQSGAGGSILQCSRAPLVAACRGSAVDKQSGGGMPTTPRTDDPLVCKGLCSTPRSKCLYWPAFAARRLGRYECTSRRLCRDPGSNRGPSDLQSDALPTELSRLCPVIGVLIIPALLKGDWHRKQGSGRPELRMPTFLTGWVWCTGAAAPARSARTLWSCTLGPKVT